MIRTRTAMCAAAAAAGAGGALILPACQVGPDYTRPELSMPAAWSEAPPPPPAEATPAIDLDRWWTSFNDAQLDSLIDRAVAANLDLRQAAGRYREALALRGVVAADAWPQVDVDASAAWLQGSDNLGGAFGNGGVGGPPLVAGGAQRDTYSAGFIAGWELDVFGRVSRAVEAAGADVQAAQENLRDVLLALLAEVAGSYVDLRGFQQRLAITNQNIETQAAAVEITEARLAAGLASELDVAQARALLAGTQSEVPVLEIGVRRAVHRLGVLLAQAPDALSSELLAAKPIPLPDPAAPDSGLGAIPLGVPSDLLRRRPDVRRAEQELAAATARIGVATADLFPRFSLTGSFGFASDDLGNLADSDSQFWSIGPTVRWPIFDAGRIASNIKVQDARQEQALAAYQRTVLLSLEEVENVLASSVREEVRRRALAEAVAANTRASDLAQELYTRGLRDFLPVVDAQRSLYESQDLLVQSDQAIAQNLIALCKALGGGWTEGAVAH